MTATIYDLWKRVESEKGWSARRERMADGMERSEATVPSWIGSRALVSRG